MKVKITRGKFEGINACADSRGVIAALAVDHRGNLLEAIARARGNLKICTVPMARDFFLLRSVIYITAPQDRNFHLMITLMV